MQNTFQCPKCNSDNLIGQTFCVNCGHKLEYDCPYCGNPVDPSIVFCTSCGSTLTWPEQNQPATETSETVKGSQQTTIDHRYRYSSSERQSKRRWSIGFTVLIVLLFIIAGAIFAADIFNIKLFTFPGSEEPVTEPPPQSSPAQPVITPTILSFDAKPAEILLGESVKLQWDVSDATSLTIEPDIGEVQSSGELSLSPKTSTTYKLTATNKEESVIETVSVSVIENIRAADIVLTENDVKPADFIFNTHSEPTLDNTVSTFYAIYIRTDETFGISVYVFKDIASVEEYYLQTKTNNRTNIGGITDLGDVGYYLTFIGDPAAHETYSIRFIKNNVYVNITGLKDYDELESFGKIIESRIK